MVVNGVKLDQKQEAFYRMMLQKNPALGKRFLAEVKKRQDQDRAGLENVLHKVRAEAVDLAGLRDLDNYGVHNFSTGAFECYFYLDEMAKAGNAFLFRGRIFVMKSKAGGGWKTWVYEARPEDMEVLAGLQKLGPVYSIHNLEGMPKGSKFKEICYDLERIFDPSSYPNAKKRYKKTKLPFVWLQDHAEVRPLMQEDLPSARALHEVWVAHKLADSATFQMMFPRKRYIHCVEKALSSASCVDADYKAFGVWVDGELAVVRVAQFYNTNAFDLAFYANTWSGPSNIANYFNTWFLKYCLDNGLKVFNCGASLNKGLASFKSELPHRELFSSMYSQIKGSK